MTVSLIPQNGRSARTRTALVEAGLRLFAERPIDAVPIDDIVASAGVAKGSFFNHFADKRIFADGLAKEIRGDIEARVATANANLVCPLQRLTGGMMVAVDFALTERDRTIVMLRGTMAATTRDHPLNRGLREDIDAGIAAGDIPEKARAAGLLFWLGNCQMLMMNVIERQPTRAEAAIRLKDIMHMALVGLGVDESKANALASDAYLQLAELGAAEA